MSACRWLHRWSKWSNCAAYNSPYFRFYERRECVDCRHVQMRSISTLDMDELELARLTGEAA